MSTSEMKVTKKMISRFVNRRDFLTDDNAVKTLNAILQSYDDISGMYDGEKTCGVYQEDAETWIAFDNTDSCCWIEEFPCRAKAILYASTDMSADDVNDLSNYAAAILVG